MQLKIKKILTLSLVSIFISINSYSKNIEPYIKLDDDFFYSENVGSASISELSPDNSFKYHYRINESMSNIEKEPFLLESLVFLKQYSLIKYKGYKIKTYFHYHGSKDVGLFRDDGIYVFNKNNICIGYVSIIKGQKTGDLSNESTKSGHKISELQQDNTYLGNKLLRPRNTITFYKKEHDNYIERFGLNEKYLFLDGFYPKELDSFMSKKILEILNFNYTAKDKIPNYRNMTQEQFSDYADKLAKKSYCHNEEDEHDEDKEDHNDKHHKNH